MAVSKIKINTASLKRDTDNIKKMLSDIEKKAIKMQTDVVQMNGMWEGEANMAFNKVFQDDITALRTVIKEVQGIVDYEENAKKEYDNCETRVSELVDSISV